MTQTDRNLARAFAFGRTAWTNNVNACVFDTDFMAWWDRQVFDGNVVAKRGELMPFMKEWNRGWNQMQTNFFTE